ncbi:hypothetical protein CROQUDRAFT_669146 [Cronartium quercuum f. sp. fusiforme G11]|uniref:Phytochrome n=1 Tax=Cronartium quercuum f. sp. fusiforme G11 TaxID=708437 RepID=A0A9P6NSU6_9BASI|nr:hypothetical protein CROQUDRAFT_669146 [Cronartium quercuum f. sp. fusiforme G11]
MDNLTGTPATSPDRSSSTPCSINSVRRDKSNGSSISSIQDGPPTSPEHLHRSFHGPSPSVSTSSLATATTSERIFPIRSILNVRKDQPSPHNSNPQRSPVTRGPGASSSAGNSPVIARDHALPHRNFTASDSMSSIDENKPASAHSQIPSSHSSRSSTSNPANMGAGAPIRHSRAMSLTNIATRVNTPKKSSNNSSSSPRPSTTSCQTSPNAPRSRPSPAMLINLSGLHDLPAGSTPSRSISLDPLLTIGPESKSHSDETTRLRATSYEGLTRPNDPTPEPPAPLSVEGEPAASDNFSTGAGAPTLKADVGEDYLTTRFEHAQTDEGFIILTGRSGEITKCEDEPIRVPGAIQAFGVLIAVILHGDFDVPPPQSSPGSNDQENSALDFSDPNPEPASNEDDADTSDSIHISRVEVVQVSENSGLILGHSPHKLLSLHSLTDIFAPSEVQVLYDNLEVTLEAGQEDAGPHTFRLSGQGGRGSGLEGRSSKSTWTCWCAAHRPDPVGRPRLIIIEFELESDTVNPPSVISSEPLRYEERGGMAGEPYQPTKEDLMESTRSVVKPLKALSRLRKKGKDFSGDSVEVLSILAQVHDQFDKAKDMPSFLKMVVGVVRELTGFHRVMVYQFDESWNGQVVAELVDWKQTRDLYRGLRFPATDIPAQARELYRINKVRMLYDRDMPTARMMCRSAEELRTPLDMSHCHLRAMSPIHIKYLANMGVRASFSISIISNNNLWGLISCHSYGRYGHRVTFPTRHFCRMLGEAVSRNIERLYLSQRLQSRKLINTAATAANPSGYIVAKAEDLLWLFDAEFGVLSIGEEAKILGTVVNSQELLAVLEYLRIKAFDVIQASTDISDGFSDIAYPAAFKTICGMLVIPLSRGGQDFIAFFRQGQLKQIHWAGNPYEKMGESASTPNSFEQGFTHHSTLEPRKSFKIWSETVRGRSKPWTEEQIETGSVLSLVYGKFIDVWRQKEAAVHTNQLQTLLLSNASHEVRTPLHQILSTLELALDGHLDEETRDNLSRSYHASRALVHVINDLLDLTKAEQGGDLFSRDPLHLASTIEEAVSIHRREAERKGLRFDLIEDPAGTPSTVTGDRARLRQVVSNLVGNAVKHTSSGSVIVLWGEEKPEKESGAGALVTEDLTRIFISVIDTGRGIEEAKLESIFRAFEQVDTGESADGDQPEESLGLGLGLAVVGRVVHNLGGQLRVDSKVDKGSKFTIILPFTVLLSNTGSLPSRRSSLSQSDNSGAMIRGLSDESNGPKTSAQRRLLLAKRSSRGSAGSGSHSEISGLVEAIQAPNTSDVPSSSLRTPFSPSRQRLRGTASNASHKTGPKSSEEGQTGSSFESSSNSLEWAGATRFEWPPIKSKGGPGTGLSPKSSKSTAVTPRILSSDKSTTAQLTRTSLPKVETKKKEMNHLRCLSDNALVPPRQPTPASPSGLSPQKVSNKSNTPENSSSLKGNNSASTTPKKNNESLGESMTPGKKLGEREKLDKPPLSSPSPSPSRLSASAESKGSMSCGGSQASNHSKLDHISNFTRSQTSRVLAKQPMRVMVVDDDPINRVILKKKLTLSGHTVSLTVHGLEAVELFSSDEQFDIILMDLQMPICDGLEATRRIREFERGQSHVALGRLPRTHRLNQGVPILAVSASLHERQRAEIADAGMDGWILKPVDFIRLSTLMAGAVDTKVRAGEVYKPGLWEKGGFLGLPRRKSSSSHSKSSKSSKP